MAFEPIYREDFYLNVVKKIHVIIKQDLERYYWGKVYDSGTLVYSGFAMQNAEKAKQDVMEWVEDNYKTTRLKPKEQSSLKV